MIPEQIRLGTNKSAVNLGFASSRPQDILAVQHLLDEYGIRADKTFVQLDYYYNSFERSNILEYQLIPFLSENETLERNFRYRDDYFALRYVPFFRYCKFDYRLGFREVVQNLMHRKTTVAQLSGYQPLAGEMAHVTEKYPSHILSENPVIDSIRDNAKKQKSELVFFSSPLHPEVGNRHFLKAVATKVGNLRDYTDSLANPLLFTNANHVNHNGARQFTQRFIANELKK